MSELTATLNEKAILYIDGGWDLDRRYAGRGVHGYIYNDDAPKRGTGNPKAVPTDNGYIGVDIIGNKVTVETYFDIVGGSRTLISNNESELEALLEGFKYLVIRPDLKFVQIYSDSMYVVKGVDHLLDWMSRDGMTVRNTAVKSWPLWKKVGELYVALKDIVEIKLAHIPRDASIGNSTADALAARGIVLASNDDPKVVITESPAQGYWNVKSVVPRILQAPRWYFSTTDHDYKREDGSHVYYTGSHGTKDKEDELYGKHYSDNFLGVVRVMEPDPVMENLRQAAMSKDPKQYGAIIIGHLDAIFMPKTYKELTEHGTTFLFNDPKRNTLLDAKDVKLLVEMRPAGLGFRGVNQWESMTRVLDGVMANDGAYVTTDITNILYEEREEKKKTVRKLGPGISQITKFLDLKVTFNLERLQDAPKPFEGKIRVILGADILSRNQLSALAEDVKSVRVVTWRDSDVVGRYATIVELNSGDIGIWVRTAANLYYAVKQPKLNPS
jgi:ribonuclease HI